MDFDVFKRASKNFLHSDKNAPDKEINRKMLCWFDLLRTEDDSGSRSRLFRINLAVSHL
jgi:hypothetical protein